MTIPLHNPSDRKIIYDIALILWYAKPTNINGAINRENAQIMKLTSKEPISVEITTVSS